MKVFDCSASGAVRLVFLSAIFLLAGCATQPKPPVQTVAPASIEKQREAQQQAMQAASSKKLNLKRKVAIGRVSNETMHGKSLLRDSGGNPLGKQVSDMLSQRLIESGLFLVLERPDIDALQSESDISKTELNLVGVDTLIMGSLVEFGRNTTGTKGFWSKSKKQTASAKVALRLVNTENGLAYFSATGAGEASTETGEVAFAGSTASFDGALNDKAIANAISDVVDEIISQLADRPWSTFVLSVEGSNIFISGGSRQGVKKDMLFDIKTKGKRVKSPQSGFMITLPGEKVATVKVMSTFGESETDEGAVTRIISGSIANYSINDLKVTEHESNN